MKKYLVAIVLMACMLAACGSKQKETVADIPDYTPVPTMSPQPETTKKPEESPDATEAPIKSSFKGVLTKNAKVYEEEEIDMSEVGSVNNFTISENKSVICHDENISGENTFNIYERDENGKWTTTQNEVIANFVNQYRIQVTKLKEFLLTDYDETILMGDDYVLYKIDEDGNQIAAAKLTKLFGKGTFEIHDWYWYKGNKVIMNLSWYDTNGDLKKKLCCLVDIDKEKVIKKYSHDWELRLVKDQKIYADQMDQNMITTIFVINPDNGKIVDKISASAIRKTALDRTDWDDTNNEYYRNESFSYDAYDDTLYVKYLTGVFRYDKSKKKWEQLLKETKNYSMGKCCPVIFRVADNSHFYMMGETGFYLYQKKMD